MHQHTLVNTGYNQTMTQYVKYICSRKYLWETSPHLLHQVTMSRQGHNVMLQLIESHFIMHYIAGISLGNFVSGTVITYETRSGFVLIKQELTRIALLADMTVPWRAPSKNGIHGVDNVGCRLPWESWAILQGTWKKVKNENPKKGEFRSWLTS